ncbi:MAG: S41 family peptidase [Chloroflexota bacterium]
MTADGYFRYPTLHQNKVVFVAEDDLWEVPARGGVARRLTANLGMVSHPAWSPDGRWLAFVGREEGESEVYVMPATGGPARRLTYLGSDTSVLGWTPDSQRIVFASNAGQPFRPLTPLYTVQTAGDSQPEPLPYGPARSISFGPAGGVVIGRRATDLANWKRYRGGTAGDIWIDVAGTGQFKPLLKLNSNVVSPLWLGERVYFLSDHEGIGNLYSCTPAGEDLQRHTHHEDYYARNPATDGRRIVYRAGADLYLFDPAWPTARLGSKKINIQLHSSRVQRNRRFVRAAVYLDHCAVHPKGHSLAFTTRGKAFAMSNWEGAAIQYGQPQGVRYRLAEWLADGRRLVMISDATGEETLEIHADLSQNGVNGSVERLEGLDIGRATFLKTSPKDETLILANHRHELIHINLPEKSARVLDKSDFGRIGGAAWSPDGQWVVYSLRTSLVTAAIKLCRIETGETYFVTPPRRLYDFGPSFDPTGKYIYFISFRDFDPVSDSHYFDLNFPRGGRPYLITLQKDLPNPFISLPNGETASAQEPPHNNNQSENGQPGAEDEAGEAAPKDEGEAKTEAKIPVTQIDLDGIQNRIAVFPVPEGRYYQIRGIIKNKVLFTSFPIEGRLESNGHNGEDTGKGSLEMYDLVERKKEFIVSGLNSFDVSADGSWIIYRAGKNLRVFKAGEKPDNNAKGFTKKSGWIELSRARVSIYPPDEWRQMFREAWRLQRDHFWTEDMSQVDWQQIYRRYYPLIDRLTTRSEFSDLMWEMQGELGTSHAYEFGGDYRPAPHYHQGFLAADFEYDATSGGYRLTHIVQGDPWTETFDSPLNRLGVNAQVGDIMLALDGQPLSQGVSPQQLLVNQANSEVQLTLLRANQPAEPSPAAENSTDEPNHRPQLVLVKTLRDERQARYREWVERNRNRVYQATDGRVGYVHVPDMGPFGYSEFHRYYLAESERAGLIIDVRFNGGGNVSQLLLEKLARRRLGYDQPRYGEAVPYPMHSVLGPMVALTNEFAGSDGDIFSHAFKLLGLGPLIGKRTWGGVIGIWPRHSLVDGTFTTQPEFSYWFEDVGWQVENYGTDPDIEVEITPQDYAAARDPQLEQGIAAVLKLMADKPPRLPEFGPRPNLALPRLNKKK